MCKHTVIAMAASLLAAAGTATAADMAPEFTPLTRSERLRDYLVGSFGPKSIATVVVRAGLDQAWDRPKEWDSSGRGFGQRLGNVYAKHVVRQSLQFGASSMLREDDRYLVAGRHGFLTRTRYAIASTFLARRDNGDRCFAFARMGGAASAAFISRAWQPESTSDMGSAASSFGFTIAGDLGTNVVKEFWPDLKRHFRRN